MERSGSEGSVSRVMLAQLVAGVRRALPGAERSGMLVVERSRSLAERLRGRRGAVLGVQVVTVGETMTLALRAGGTWDARIERVSGGATISRRPLSLEQWVLMCAARVAAASAGAAGDARTVASALVLLGIHPAPAEVRVTEATVKPDLHALPVLLAGRLPPDARGAVERIATLLLDTLPRVAGAIESEFAVLRAATSYLPDTLGAYLALPEQEAGTQLVADGRTAGEVLLAQLALLERAVADVRDAAVARDAAALETNGRFLESRFEAGPAGTTDLG